MKFACALLPLALMVTALLPPQMAAADDCSGTPCLGIVDIDGLVYVDDRGVLGNGVWIYLESDGQPGLQRGGCSAIVPNDCEICHGVGGEPPCDDPHDTLIV